MSTYRGFPAPGIDPRESVLERERNAAHPLLLRIATFFLVLSGAFFVVSFMFSFVMYMNARESALQESTGTYRATTFRVLQSYWQEHKGSGIQRRAFARGLVEGNQEWMDLGSYLGAVPKDEQTVLRSVPVGTLIPVFYNPEATSYYRVLLQGSVPPAESSERLKSSSVKYGLVTMSITGLLMLSFLRLRKLCF